MKLAMMAMAAALAAQEVDDRLLRLIGPDATIVYGVNYERYRTSSLARFHPIEDSRIEGARQIIVVACTDHCFPRLTIVRGDIRRPDPGDEHRLTFLDVNTAVFGAPEAVEAATKRWRQADRVTGEIAAAVRSVSSAYDNWIAMLKPLDRVKQYAPEKELGHWKRLASTVVEVRGGIRFGGVVDVNLQVTAQTADDGQALAALGRWLPGIAEAQGPGFAFSGMASLVENYRVDARGASAELSFSLSEERLARLIEEDQARRRDPVIE